MNPVMKVKKLFDDAKLPERANPTDSGADVFVYRFEKYFAHDGSECPQNSDGVVLAPNDRVLIHTGIAATVGEGFEIQVRPRSGNALKKGLTVLNSPGTIDESYRGLIGVIIHNDGFESQTIHRGDKIAQLVVCPVILSEIVEVDELDDTVRGESGFGKSGN